MSRTDAALAELTRLRHWPIPPRKDEAWKADANCAGMDPNLFFPERGEPGAVAEALAVCRACRVRAECLEFALTPPVEKDGIWGGTSGRDRRRIIRTRRRAS